MATSATSINTTTTVIPTAVTTSTTNITPKIAFISGPLEPSPTYFDEHYSACIAHAISQGHHFVLATSYGIDTIACEYLLAHSPPKHITLFLSQNEVRSRSRLAKFERAGGRVAIAGRNHTERDEAMTKASHYDILRYRTEEECRLLYGAQYRKRISGTEKNEIRRKRGVGLVWRETEVARTDKNTTAAIPRPS